MPIALFFIGHWFFSLFAQTFFLHRYAAHKMFDMSRWWERFFFAVTYVSQGSSFLNPRAYAVMHRMHHAYSDTEKDPHSPNFFRDIFQMMWTTRAIYFSFLTGKREPEEQFKGNYPVWAALERFADGYASRIFWVMLYVGFYVVYATSWWMFLLIPIHILMGPIHGAIVNWCGHKYGYRNYENEDTSKNTLNLDFLMMGELFQNNHHRHPNRPNFAVRWFEMDPTYPLLLALDAIGIIHLRSRQKGVEA